MADTLKIEFQTPGAVEGGDLVVFVGEDLKPAPSVAKRLGAKGVDLITKAAPSEKFRGKAQSAMVLAAPAGLAVDRLVVVGTGGEKDRAKIDWTQLGGFVAGKLTNGLAHVLLDLPQTDVTAEAAADAALGAKLRSYSFDRYKTKRGDDDKPKGAARVVFLVADAAAARKAHKSREGIAGGVILARDLVNEPPNVLGPVEFAARAEALSKLGVEVDVLDDKAMRKLGMRALLGVGQGSARESRVVIMRWNGGKATEQPIAFIGKGVVFDSGGISIKPGGGMEDMKGDMAGAACVVGLMHALASRRAKVNVIGAIGLVENMPDGNAQRPGDIVTTMSGQTIEIINTDAEGRLVLADVLWYVQERFKPKFMIDLATLTGAILVALAQEYAGHVLEQRRTRAALDGCRIGNGRAGVADAARAGIRQDDRLEVCRHEKLGGSLRRIEHRGRPASALRQRRAVDPSRHRGHRHGVTARPRSTRSWASGWGVRLLDRLVRDHYEA